MQGADRVGHDQRACAWAVPFRAVPARRCYAWRSQEHNDLLLTIFQSSGDNTTDEIGGPPQAGGRLSHRSPVGLMRGAVTPKCW